MKYQDLITLYSILNVRNGRIFPSFGFGLLIRKKIKFRRVLQDLIIIFMIIDHSNNCISGNCYFFIDYSLCAGAWIIPSHNCSTSKAMLGCCWLWIVGNQLHIRCVTKSSITPSLLLTGKKNQTPLNREAALARAYECSSRFLLVLNEQSHPRSQHVNFKLLTRVVNGNKKRFCLNYAVKNAITFTVLLVIWLS